MALQPKHERSESYEDQRSCPRDRPEREGNTALCGAGADKPEISQSLHRNTYDFTRENIRELEQIAIFRKAGFSLFEISIILEQPQRLPELLESKRQSLEADMEVQGNIREALARIQASEIGSVEEVAKSLRQAVSGTPAEKPKVARRWVILGVSVLLIVGICLFIHYVGLPRGDGSFMKPPAYAELSAAGVLLLLLGTSCLFMAIRYATCTRRARKLPQHATGIVTCVMDEHGFDGRFARAGSGSAGTREPGIGGTWQIHFMLWNEFRPDCWFPVIRYVDETGKERANTFLYGGFKGSWQKGDELQIAWDPKARDYIYPLEGKWLGQKALLYGFAGLVLLALAVFVFVQSGTYL